MKTTENWLSEGNLTEAIAQARRDVAKAPGDASLRFLLFELLVLAEDLDGAENELQRVAIADATLSDGVELYLQLLAAERSRYNFLTKAQGTPQAFLQPPEYGSNFVQAALFLCQSRIEEAEALLSEGWQKVPKVSGSLDEVEFSEIRDADDVLGPFLEVLIPQGYYWIPFEQLQRVEFLEKRSYMDNIWLPAYIEMPGGIKGELWIPSLYSGTGKQEDVLRLGQMTAWEYPSDNIGRVFGQRDLRTEKIVKGIRQVSTIVITG